MPTPRHYATPAARQAAYRARCRAAQPLPPAPATPGTRRWTVLLQQVDAVLATVIDEMTAVADARSARWQDSPRGEQFVERLEALDDLRARLQEVGEA